MLEQPLHTVHMVTEHPVELASVDNRQRCRHAYIGSQHPFKEQLVFKHPPKGAANATGAQEGGVGKIAFGVISIEFVNRIRRGLEAVPSCRYPLAHGETRRTLRGQRVLNGAHRPADTAIFQSLENPSETHGYPYSATLEASSLPKTSHLEHSTHLYRTRES